MDNKTDDSNSANGGGENTEGKSEGTTPLITVTAPDNKVSKVGAGRHKLSLDRKIVLVGTLLDEYKNKTSNAEICEFARTGDIENVKRLLGENSGHINDQDVLELTALHYSINAGNSELTKILLESKADVNITSLESLTPLFCAVHRNDLGTVKTLVGSNLKNLDTKTKSVGLTALDHAAELGRADIVEVLISANANTDVHDWFGESPLHRAAEGKHYEVTKHLLDATADINICDEDDATPLHRAASLGHFETVKLLVSRKADIDKQDKEDDSALRRAIVGGFSDIASYLVKHDCDVSLSDKHGETPIHYALKLKDPVETEKLLNEVRKRFALKEAQFISCDQLINVTKQKQPKHVNNSYRADFFVYKSESSSLSEITVPVICKISHEEGFILENLPKHKNVHSLLGTCLSFEFEENKPNAVVFPFKEGGNVRDHLSDRKRPLSFRRMIEWAHDMAEAVNHLHTNNIKHSDIAARSFLMTEKELDEPVEGQRLVLTNFHLARSAEVVFDEDRILPWRWSPPESLRTFGKTTLLEGDIWMTGICFWELFTVNPTPFHWISSIKQLVFLTAVEQHKTPLIFPPIFSVGVEQHANMERTWREIILKCCHYEPSERYTSKELLLQMQMLLERVDLMESANHDNKVAAESKETSEDNGQTTTENDSENKKEKSTRSDGSYGESDFDSLYIEPDSDDEVDYDELKTYEVRRRAGTTAVMSGLHSELENERKQRKQLEKDYEAVSNKLKAMEEQFSNLKKGLDISKDEVAFLASELTDTKRKLHVQVEKGHSRKISRLGLKRRSIATTIHKTS